MLKKTFLYLFGIFIIQSCNITDIIDPSNTTYELIKFRIDGKKWLPSAPAGYTPNVSLVSGHVTKNSVIIFASRGEAAFLNPNKITDEEFRLGFENLTETGKYNIETIEKKIFAKFLVGDGKTWTEEYNINPKLGGYLKIEKFQPENEFCQGEFELVLQEAKTGKIKKIKNGHFAISTN